MPFYAEFTPVLKMLWGFCGEKLRKMKDTFFILFFMMLLYKVNSWGYIGYLKKVKKKLQVKKLRNLRYTVILFLLMNLCTVNGWGYIGYSIWNIWYFIFIPPPFCGST